MTHISPELLDPDKEVKADEKSDVWRWITLTLYYTSHSMFIWDANALKNTVVIGNYFILCFISSFGITLSEVIREEPPFSGELHSQFICHSKEVDVVFLYLEVEEFVYVVLAREFTMKPH